MSKIIPLSALIPKAHLAENIIAPPYDIIDSKEARKAAQGNPYSILHITKAEIDFEECVSEYDDRVYEKARKNLGKFVEKGWLFDDAPSFYIYRMQMRSHVQTGVAALVSAKEYDEGLIKRHELTKKEKEDDRTRFALSISAHAEPVILVCKNIFNIKGIISDGVAGEPLYNVTDLFGVRHTLWRANNKFEIEGVFAKMSALYIADGHHRSATASRVRKTLMARSSNHTGSETYNFFPAVIFPHDEVVIYRYNWEGSPDKRPLADVTMEDVMKLADQNGILPPKSTWFAPKLTSGLFLQKF